MKIYARIEDGIVLEVIEPMTDAENNEIPIADRFTSAFVETLVDATGVVGVAQGWLCADGVFSAPPEETLARVQDALIATLAQSCKNAITSGFTSSALGVALTYPSQDNDQRNLQSAVSAAAAASQGWTIPLWCTDGDHWSFTSHTAAQLQQVNADWLAHRVAAQQKYADLIAQINAATSVEEVQAIHW